MNHSIPATICIVLFSQSLLASECIPTPHRTTGTHYAPVTEHKVNISSGLTVRGRVLGSDCKPLKQTRVAHWQAGINGRYTDRLRAYLFTDEEGYFKFETEWPNLTPPHIHFIVTARGYNKLETQWIGDKQVPGIEFNMVLEKAD